MRSVQVWMSSDHSEPRNLKTQMSFGRRGVFGSLFFRMGVSPSSLNKDLEGDFFDKSKIALKITNTSLEK